jgi:hypothetical protein
MNKRAVRQAALHLPGEVTIYQRFGNSWLWLAGLFIFGRLGQAYGSGCCKKSSLDDVRALELTT